jgi:hypothetical protein
LSQVSLVAFDNVGNLRGGRIAEIWKRSLRDMVFEPIRECADVVEDRLEDLRMGLVYALTFGPPRP